jgi:hypothetical protein
MAGFGDLEFMQRGRRMVLGAAMLLLGGVLGYTLPQSNASPASEAGSVLAVGNSTQDSGIMFDFKPDKGPRQRFRLEPATPWQATPSGRWQREGRPTCVIPGSTAPTAATLGVVTARSVGSAPARSIVVWVECYR